jgi:hypothetical protein
MGRFISIQSPGVDDLVVRGSAEHTDGAGRFVLRVVYALRDPRWPPEIARREIARGIRRYSGRGDGTLSAVVRHFIGSTSVRGVLPWGRGQSVRP